ncbi:MAG: hypothetical protein RSB41_01150 [Bacilli bacterium]
MLEKSDLELINGGFRWGILAIFGGFITFIIGAFDGYLRPYRCR